MISWCHNISTEINCMPRCAQECAWIKLKPGRKQEEITGSTCNVTTTIGIFGHLSMQSIFIINTHESFTSMTTLLLHSHLAPNKFLTFQVGKTTACRVCNESVTIFSKTRPKPKINPNHKLIIQNSKDEFVWDDSSCSRIHCILHNVHDDVQ